MKKFNIVKIVKLTDIMQKLNLQLGFHSSVLNSAFDYSKVLFLNDSNLGQSTICKVENTSIQKEQVINNETLVDFTDVDQNEIYFA